MAKSKMLEFQVHMKTDETFQKHVMNDEENLWVIDVYTEWCGYCTCAVGTFQKANIRYGGEPIKFGTATTDHIDFLSKYTGTSQPTFMFLAGKGTVLDVVRGVNVPLINSKIKKFLASEEKVKKGEEERVAFIDEVLLTPEPVVESPEVVEEAAPERQLTVALIKPDAVAAGKVEEILTQLDKCDIEVVSQIEREMTREDAESFYQQHEGTDFFLQLVDYMTSGPIVALALAAKSEDVDVVTQWRNLIGPKDVAIAREEAPESLRAQFASGDADENFKNALHGSDSADQAARELAFFFPAFHQNKQTPAPVVQRTLALIRPDALRKYREDILEKIRASGFQIANAKEVQLNAEQAAEFYREHEGQDYFEKLVKHMSSGPVMALALCREDAVTGWRDMLGPKNVDEAKDLAPERDNKEHNLRAQYVEDEEDPALNALHGSDSLESAEREVNFFFPKQQTLAVIKPHASHEEKDMIMSKIRSSGFHIAAQKETTLTRDLAEQFYSEHKDKEFFGELTEMMSSGPTMFMVLSREDAISGMRDMVGPADPEEAKKVAPESIRAAVGKSIVENAIHAATDEDKALLEIKLAFGDELEFDENGKIKETLAEPDDAEIEGAAHAETPAEQEPAPEVPGVTPSVTGETPKETPAEIQEKKEAEETEETGTEEEGKMSEDTKKFLEEIAREAEEEVNKSEDKSEDKATEDNPSEKPENKQEVKEGGAVEKKETEGDDKEGASLDNKPAVIENVKEEVERIERIEGNK